MTRRMDHKNRDYRAYSDKPPIAEPRNLRPEYERSSRRLLRLIAKDLKRIEAAKNGKCGAVEPG